PILLALGATSPAANADTVDIPSLPIAYGDETNPESLGVVPFFAGQAFEQNGTYTICWASLSRPATTLEALRCSCKGTNMRILGSARRSYASRRDQRLGFGRRNSVL